MKLIKGNLWDYFGATGYAICITTNATVKKNGEAVMGRGCALQAAQRFPELPALLGAKIKEQGHSNGFIGGKGIYSFQVKYNWWEKADLELIKDSVEKLNLIQKYNGYIYIYILPKPGCGNGQLDWKDVEPILRFLPDNVWVIDHA